MKNSLYTAAVSIIYGILFMIIRKAAIESKKDNISIPHATTVLAKHALSSNNGPLKVLVSIADTSDLQTQNRHSTSAGLKKATIFIINFLKTLARPFSQMFSYILSFFPKKTRTISASAKGSISNMTVGVSTDHLPGSYFLSILSSEQKSKVDAAFTALQNKNLDQLASATNWEVNKHLIYRYFCSCDWSDKYYGKSIADAAESTLRWRYEAGVTTLHTDDLHDLVSSGQLYVLRTDKRQRPVIYFRPGMQAVEKGDGERYLRLLMHTIERADRMSVAAGTGEIIVLVDMGRFAMSRSPPVSVIKNGISLLKLHYPYRLRAVYIFNAGMAFSLLWNIVKPLLSQKVIGKTFVLGKKEVNARLIAELGRETLESEYGGDWVRGEELLHGPSYFQNQKAL